VIPSSKDLETLAAFKAKGQSALSVYLDMTTAEKRKSAYSYFETMTNQQLREHGTNYHCRRMLQEDMDVVQMCLSNRSTPGVGIAIFSCASSLFWRAYSLPVAVPNRVDIGSVFDLDPLRRAMKEIERRQELLAEAI